MAQIENLDKLLKKLENLNTISVEQAVNEACILVENDAKRRCPVDTGELRFSITHEVERTGENSISGIVGTNTSYAPYVEFGTGIFSSLGNGRQDKWSYKDAKGEWHTTIGQQPQPYLHPALDTNRAEIEELIRQKIQEGVKHL